MRTAVRLSPVAGPSNLCRSYASTPSRSANPELDKKATSTYSAILASLTDSLEKNAPNARSTRRTEVGRDGLEDLEAAWANRPIYGDPSWPAKPYSGRSVAVIGGDVNRAFMQLNQVLSRNNVRRELKLGDRYEKPNRERNRKKSERHRRRFADMVRRKVQLVSFIVVVYFRRIVRLTCLFC